MLHNSVPYSAYLCFLAETAESCAHLGVSVHASHVMSDSKWNRLCVNRKNELLTVSKRRIAPVSDLWRRSAAGSLPSDEHARKVREAEKDKHNVPSNLQVGRERASSTTQQNYTLQLHKCGRSRSAIGLKHKSHIQIILELKTWTDISDQTTQ